MESTFFLANLVSSGSSVLKSKSWQVGEIACKLFFELESQMIAQGVLLQLFVVFFKASNNSEDVLLVSDTLMVHKSRLAIQHASQIPDNFLFSVSPSC